MPAVTQLQPAVSDLLAEVSGAPRPTVGAPRRPDAGQGTVLEFRPPVDPTGQTDARISAIARSVSQGALEVLGGSRPLQQMARWLDPENYERLQLRTNLVRCVGATRAECGADTSAHRQVVVRSARVCPVGDGVYEASVVAFDRKRIRAVALRIEQRRGSWRVTALEIG